MQTDAQISFIVPLRWFKKPDNKFLEKNLRKMIGRGNSNVKMHPKLMATRMTFFQVELNIHANNYVKLGIKKEDLTAIFQKLFLGVTLISIDKFFTQTRKASSPYVEVKIFHN